jgi:integrase
MAEENQEREKMSRPKGTGCIYQRAGTSAWWIKYSRNGRAFCESTHTTDKRKAGKMLRTRLGEITAGTFLGPAAERITVEELAKDFLSEYRINDRKSVDDAEARWQLHLKPFFGVHRATEISTPLLNRYIESRQQQGAKNATINRELAALKRAFNLGRQNQKVRMVPIFPRLTENNIRTGFLSDEQYHKLAAQCPELWLRAALEVARKYCWRRQEVMGMRVSQIDLANRTIRLEPGTTKNREGREVSMTGSVYTLLAECVRGKGQEDYVFTWPNGKPVRDFRGTWHKVCESAGVPGLLFHDLRRTAARNLRRAGVAESIIMKIGGWKTRSTFERYNIITQADIQDALLKLEASEQKSDQTQNGYRIGYSEPKKGQVANPPALN